MLSPELSRELRTADCGLRIDCGFWRIRNPESEINPQSAIRNPQ